MDEVTNQSSEQEIVQQQEIASPETETKQDIQAQEKPPEEKSWVNRLRRERDEAIRKANMQEELMQRLMAQQAQVNVPQASQEDFIEDLSKEEFVAGEKVAKSLKKMQEDFKKQLQEVKNQYQQSKYMDSISELKREYPDLEDVVNPDTLQIVKEKNPRLAQAWQNLDDYSIYVQAYPYIKNMGILEEVPGSKRTKEIEKKIEQNKKIVQSPQAYEKRPMAQAFNSGRLTESQKKELYEEMHGFARMSGGY
jgi:hypothetical protein